MRAGLLGVILYKLHELMVLEVIHRLLQQAGENVKAKSFYDVTELVVHLYVPHRFADPLLVFEVDAAEHLHGSFACQVDRKILVFHLQQVLEQTQYVF